MTTTTKTPKVYPGMICDGVEFFLTEGKLKVIRRGSTQDFADAPYSYHLLIEEQIEKEPETKAALEKWHPDSKLKQRVQFASCRYGGLDYTPDIIGFKLQDGDMCDCPNRDSCPFEGLICKPPKYHGKEISFAEVKLLRLLASSDTNEVIAEKLGTPFGTFHQIKKKLYEKLGIQTKPEATVICHELNLI